MQVSVIQCPECKEKIYSRTRHDFHWCHCGKVAIDGGFDYLKITGIPVMSEPGKIKVDRIEINATKQELYEDWNSRKNNYGWIKD